jgi:hypothetical protein
MKAGIKDDTPSLEKSHHGIFDLVSYLSRPVDKQVNNFFFLADKQ